MKTVTCERCKAETPTVLLMKSGAVGCQNCFDGKVDQVDEWLAASDYQATLNAIGEGLLEKIKKTKPLTGKKILEGKKLLDAMKVDDQLADDIMKTAGAGHPFLTGYIEPPKKPDVISFVKEHTFGITPDGPPVHLNCRCETPVTIKREFTVEMTFEGDLLLDPWKCINEPEDFEEALFGVKLEAMMERQQRAFTEHLVQLMAGAAGYGGGGRLNA